MNTTYLLPHLKLRLHIDYPDLEECYAEGYEASCNDCTETSNPYPTKTAEHEHWNDGWWDGIYKLQL